MNGWIVERSVGPAEDFHHRDLSSVVTPTVWIHRVERPALVLGSSQRDPIVDHVRAEAHDIEVCRRRSGGGLVLIDPATSCWIDVVVTPDSRLWDDDVNRAFLWVGNVWAAALGASGVADLTVHPGPVVDAERGRFLCFAGIGPGEVLQHAEPAHAGADRPWKVVGLSQRRQRTAARFQGLFVTSTDIDLTARLLLPGAWPTDLDPTALRVGLADPALRTRGAVDVEAVADHFVARLPAP